MGGEEQACGTPALTKCKGRNKSHQVSSPTQTGQSKYGLRHYCEVDRGLLTSAYPRLGDELPLTVNQIRRHKQIS